MSKKRAARRRVIRAVGIVLGLTMAVVGLTAAGYLKRLDDTVSANVRHAALLPQDVPQLPGHDAGPSSTRDQAAEQDRRAMNVLIVGSDERPGEDRARSDVIIVAHLDADRRRVHLVHFPRDLYVRIPGRPGRDRINAAYRYGGMPLLARTVRSLTGVRVDHAAQIDFERFKAMTDAVGGLVVHVEEASPRFPRGDLAMNGQQALDFVRERKMLSQGDISRGRRELAFLKALMLKALSRETLTNPARFADVLDAATTNLTVDTELTIDQIRAEVIGMRSLRSRDVVFHTAPLGRFFTTRAGAMVIDTDLPALARLGTALQRDRMDDYRG